MALKLDHAKYEVSLVELGGEAVKLINLIDRAVTVHYLYTQPIVYNNN